MSLEAGLEIYISTNWRRRLGKLTVYLSVDLGKGTHELEQITKEDTHVLMVQQVFPKLSATLYGLVYNWVTVLCVLCFCGKYIWLTNSWNRKLCKKFSWWCKFKESTMNQVLFA